MPRRLKRNQRSFVAPRTGTNSYFAYARVSSQEQADRDLSIPAQLREIHEYARRQGWQIAEEFVDVESAKEPGRKQFTAMMERLRKDGRIDGIVCHKVDRLLRNIKDYALLEDLINANIELKFVTGSFDRSPAGMLGLGMQVLLARHYLHNLSQEVKKGLDQRMLYEGKWAFQAPFGYINKEREILPDPERFDTLRQAWALLVSGRYSLKELSTILYKLGLRTRGSRRFPAGQRVGVSALHHLFTNHFYYGVMPYKGGLVRGTHQPMISKPVFDRAAEILRSRGHPRPIRLRFLYRGLLVCGECGRMVTAERKKGHIYYRCSKSRGGAASCRQPYLREEALEAQLARQLGAIQLDETALVGLREALTELHGHERKYRAEALAAMRTRYDDVQKKKDILLDRHLAGVVPGDEYTRKLAALKEEQVVIETELRALEVAQERFFEVAELLLQLAGRLGEVFEQGTDERKLAVVKLVASNATLKDRNARLNLFPPFEVLAKAGGHTRWLGEEDSNPR